MTTRSKRLVGTILIGLGVFLVVAAGLVRFYALPSLARVPTNYDETTHSEATGAQVLDTDPKVMAPQKTDLSISTRTVADSGAHAPDDVAVWENATTITRADGTIFQQSRSRFAFDKVSGAAVSCASCDTWSETVKGEQTPTDFKGQVVKFPFNTQKHSYDFWDSTIGQATPAVYSGTEKTNGLTVYKFVQTIDPQVLSYQQVPGSVFGIKAPTAYAAVWYGMTRTLYVEPATGDVVNRVEDRTQQLRFQNKSAPAFVGTVQYTASQVAQNVKDVKTDAMLLKGARLWFPLLALILGLALLVLGWFYSREGGGTRTMPRRASDRDLVDA